jgi:Protein of unknown function (DUF2281)
MDFNMTIAETVYEKLKIAPPEIAREVLDFLEFLEAKKLVAEQKPAQPPSLDDFIGSLKGSKVFEGDPVEIQRQMRAEWDRDWDR